MPIETSGLKLIRRVAIWTWNSGSRFRANDFSVPTVAAIVFAGSTHDNHSLTVVAVIPIVHTHLAGGHADFLPIGAAYSHLSATKRRA
jgi:hypothetical protein